MLHTDEVITESSSSTSGNRLSLTTKIEGAVGGLLCFCNKLCRTGDSLNSVNV